MKVPQHPLNATPAGYHAPKGLGCFRVRSPLLTESLLFSIRPATKMFQFTGCPLPTLCVQVGVTGSVTDQTGYPIRKSSGIKARLQLPPKRIVAYHVLHRPSAPRHPPRALRSLISTSQLMREERSTATRRASSSVAGHLASPKRKADRFEITTSRCHIGRR